MNIKINNNEINIDGVVYVKKSEAVKKEEVKKDFPQVGWTYWIVDQYGGVNKTSFSDDTMDAYRISIGNIFETEALASQHLAYLKALTEVKRFIKENKLGKEFLFNDDNWIVAKRKEGLKGLIIYSDNDIPTLGYLISSKACKRVIAEQLENLKIIYGVK